jgi:hypothetical protein
MCGVRLMAYERPVATVVTSEKKGDVVVTVLKFDEVPSSPVAPASLWVWLETDEPVAVIELHRVTKCRRKELTFETYNSNAKPLIAGSIYKFISWWGDSQLDIAQSNPARWEKREFEPKDAVKLHTSDGLVMARKFDAGEALPKAEIVQGGWNHEHCFLCWKRISQHEDDEQVGYTDGKDWLCEACYERFVASGFGNKLGEAA